MKIRNHAKINLSLDIKGKLENGYHELEMLMQLIEIYDELDIQWHEGGNGLEINLSGNRDDVPYGPSNLVWKAAVAMNEIAQRSGRLDVYIEKHIPVAAGLAGGSGNAAAVITGLNELWDMGLTTDEMAEIGAGIGKDIPFLVYGYPCAIATYDGTVLKEHIPLDAYIVLSKPDISVSTKEMYEKYDSMVINKRPDNRALSAALQAGDVRKTGENLGNVLEIPAVREYNCINNTKDNIRKMKGILGVSMSGSGPSVFGICTDKAAADRAAEELLRVNRETFSTHTVTERGCKNDQLRHSEP